MQTVQARAPFPPLWKLVVPLMIAEIVASLELTMIYAAMRSLIADFGSASAAGWLVTSFMLSSAAGSALFGRLGDLLGRRRILLWVLVTATLGSLISACSHDLGWLVFGRVLQGAAGSVIPLCFGIVRQQADPARGPLAISLLASAAALSSALGLVLGGIVVDLANWSMIFKVTSGVGVLAFLCVLVFVRRDGASQPGAVRDDLAGGLLFVPATVFLLLAIDNAGKAGLADSHTVIFALIAVLSLAGWIWRELSVRNPLIDVRMLATRAVGWANLIAVALAFGAFQAGQIMALFGQQSPSTGAGLGLSATMSGMLLLPANLISAFLYPLAARANQRFGPRDVAASGFLLILVSFGSLMIWNANFPIVMALLIIQSVGLGIIYVTIPLIIIASAPPDRTSEATGMMAVIRTTAMAIGAQTVATMLSAGGHHGAGAVHFPSHAAYMSVFAYICATAVAGILMTRMLPVRLPVSAGH